MTIEEEDIDTPFKRVTRLVKNIFGAGSDSHVSNFKAEPQASSDHKGLKSINEQALEISSIRS